MNVILADDHVMLREGLRSALQTLGREVAVHEASTLSAVMQCLERVQANLVILGLEMPGMADYGPIGQTKNMEPTAKCVVLSAKCDRQFALGAIAAGADGYIPKQMSQGAMVSALKLVMAGETYVPSMVIQAVDHGAERAERSRGGGLTRRERDVLLLLRNGMSNKAIANRLGISDVTVKTHLSQTFRKLGVHNRLQAMRLMLERSPMLASD